MVVIDQLRISDDGKKLFLDAHVNKADFFHSVFIDDVTIVTDDQLLKYSSKAIEEEYIFKKEISPKPTYTPIGPEVDLYGYRFKQALAKDSSWQIVFPPVRDVDGRAFSCYFSGKLDVEDGYTAKIVVTTEEYQTKEGLEGDNVITVIPGKTVKTEDETIWQFKGKAEVGINTAVKFYLYKTDKDGNAILMKLNDIEEDSLEFIYTRFTVQKYGGLKEVHLVLDRNDFNEKFCETDLSKHMYFVYIKAFGVPAPGTPCRLDEMTTVGVTFDYGLIYYKALGYMKELADKCKTPTGFIDYILNLNALKLAIETDHYIPAIQYFKHLLNGDYTGGAIDAPIARPCGCGR